MAIYTKTGDDGTTTLYGGRRVLKSASVVEAYGTIDELTSIIGLVISKNRKDKALLTGIQKDLFLIMGFIAEAKVNLEILDKKVEKFERIIDQKEKELQKINKFILPQGTGITCWFHVLRAVCRRAERRVTGYKKSERIIVRYLNRLSDLFYVLARWYNKKKEITI
jgi:cob(I)alamin adenosyltransferase